MRHVDLPLNPYGALASKFEQKVWFTNARWQETLPDNPPAIVSVDFRTGEVSPRYEVQSDDGGCVGTYGITVDAEGRVWVAGHGCERAFRFDPDTEDWMFVEPWRERVFSPHWTGLLYQTCVLGYPRAWTGCVAMRGGCWRMRTR